MGVSSIAEVAFAVSVAAGAHASIIAGPTVNGLATFQDTSTGLVWLKLNDFFNESAQQMVATAAASGFTWSDATHAESLLADLPLGNNQWSTYAATIGSAPNRDLYWASYGPASDGSDEYSYAYSDATSWSGCPACDDYASVENGNGPYADMNVFAYAASVPEPASWAVFGVSLVALGLFRYRRA